MGGFTRLLLVLALGCGLWGCATSGPVSVAPTPVERPTFFYVGAMELPLKSAPEPGSSTVTTVSLNQKVQQLERRSSWFLVRTESGQQGWANDRDLKLRPVTDLYVRRWGVALRTAPQASSKRLARLRTNDQVALVEKNSGWAKVTVARTGNTGWVQLNDLSLDKVAVRRYYRSKSKTASGKEEAAESAATPGGVGSGLLEPKAANAAPPPAKPSPAVAPRKAKPGMFEPF